eukprot:3153561-Karenia_brevis.AAC.1
MVWVTAFSARRYVIIDVISFSAPPSPLPNQTCMLFFLARKCEVGEGADLGEEKDDRRTPFELAVELAENIREGLLCSRNTEG